MPDQGVVDEIQMQVRPAAHGAGRRIVTDRGDPTLLEAIAFDNGPALLRYEITKEHRRHGLRRGHR